MGGQRLRLVDPSRPRDRSECVDGPRPCPYVSCRYHLLLDVSPKTGKLKLNFGTDDPAELPDTCSLDVAARGAETLDVVGAAMNVTRERARQIEAKALAKVAAHPITREIAETEGVDLVEILRRIAPAEEERPERASPGVREPAPPPGLLRALPAGVALEEDDVPVMLEEQGTAPFWRPPFRLGAWLRWRMLARRGGIIEPCARAS